MLTFTETCPILFSFVEKFKVQRLCRVRSAHQDAGGDARPTENFHVLNRGVGRESETHPAL
jgi:hypothetical protein